MKKLLVASVAAVLFGTAAAQADSYVSVLGGPTFAPDLSVNGFDHRMDTGFNVGARYGYYLNGLNLPNASLEADWMLNQSTYSNFSNARLQSNSFMANAIYHLPTGTPFELYGGPGLGLVNTNIDDGGSHHGGSAVLGWQALAGLEYRASEQASIFAEYRYQDAHDVNAGGLTRVGNTSHNLSFGVKWRLD